MRNVNILLLALLIGSILISGVFSCNAQIPVKVNITSPTNGEHVPLSIQVEGTMDGELPSGHYLWIMVNPRTAFAQWWPQGRHNIDPGKTWYGPALIGRDIRQGGEADFEKEFDIAVVLVNENVNKDFLYWYKKAELTGNWPSMNFPEDARIMDKVTVIRETETVLLESQESNATMGKWELLLA
jgi:hypothetical protein